MPVKDKKGLYEIGDTELVGNLKGCGDLKVLNLESIELSVTWKTKNLFITVLTVEGRSDSCNNKEVLAKKARKEVINKK